MTDFNQDPRSPDLTTLESLGVLAIVISSIIGFGTVAYFVAQVVKGVLS